MLVWVRIDTGQPFKVSIADCEDVSDLIEAAKSKVGAQERLDELHLFVMSADGFGGQEQRPGKPLAQVLEENTLVGRDDDHAFIIRKATSSHSFGSLPFKFPEGFPDIPWPRIQSHLQREWNAVNWLTIAYVAFNFPFTNVVIPSATFLFIVLKVAVYFALPDYSRLKRDHFTCSAQNMAEGRYWTLITSSLAHVDINHLICNLVALANLGAFVEFNLGFKRTVLFFVLASIASCTASLWAHGQPHVGSSGVIYAMEGLLWDEFTQEDGIDWFVEVVDFGLFIFAADHADVDNAAHFGGFLFGSATLKLWLQ